MSEKTSFKDVKSWLTAVSEGQPVAIMSSNLASSALGESASALSKKLKSGEIARISIEKVNYISAHYVHQVLTDRRQTWADVVAILERVARRKAVIFYGDLMGEVGMRWQSPPDRNTIGHLLGQISRQSYLKNGILLSAIVHRKGPPPTHPGPGYIGLLQSMDEEIAGFDYDPEEDEEDIIDRHVKAVWDFYETH